MIRTKPRVDKINSILIYFPDNSIMTSFLVRKPIADYDFTPRKEFLDFSNRAVSSDDITKP